MLTPELKMAKAANGTNDTLSIENIRNPAMNALSSSPLLFLGRTNNPSIATKNSTAPKTPKVSVNLSGPC